MNPKHKEQPAQPVKVRIYSPNTTEGGTGEPMVTPLLDSDEELDPNTKTTEI